MSTATINGQAQLPPHNLQAEAGLLGGLLITRKVLDDVVEITRPEHFYRPAHRDIYQAALDLSAAGEPIDGITVADHLARTGRLDRDAAGRVVVELMTGSPTPANAGRYARIVEDLWLMRRLIATGQAITAAGYGMPPNIQDAIADAERAVYDVAQNRHEGTLVHIREALEAVLNRAEQLYEQGDSATGQATGLFDLDQLLGGLQPGSLYVLGARPAMGKTAAALGIAAHCAVVDKRPCVFTSLEMSAAELTQRLVCSEARVDATRMRKARLGPGDWERIGHAVGRVGEAPLYIDDNPTASLSEIRSKARKVRAKHQDLGLVVVDYVQLMVGRSTAENRQVEIAELSRGLKVLARELDVPVLALSQLNRSLEQRADKRPMLADLRESGALEQDSDVVLFLFRDEVYNRQSEDKGIAELIVAKHRSGPTGVIRLSFLSQFTKFVNMATA